MWHLSNEYGGRCYCPLCVNAFRDWLNADSKKDFDTMDKVGYSYGLGVRTLIDDSLSRSPIGEFGWDGAAGAWTMVDVDNHIAAFYVQHVHNCGYAFTQVHPDIRNLIYEGLATE